MLLTHPLHFAPRIYPTLLAAIATVALAGCGKPDITQTAEYQSLCHGQPLKTVEARNQAMEDGYLINNAYKCIDKKSFEAVEKIKAERAFAKTPEGIAQRQAEEAARDAQRAAELAERRAQREAERAAREASIPKHYVLRLVEANTASQEELAHVCAVGDKTAADIVNERNNAGKFVDWTNLVHRVMAFRAAEITVFASACGLTVQGESFSGAPADQDTAQAIYERERKRRLSQASQ